MLKNTCAEEVEAVNISKDSIVSNSDMIKRYKHCRKLADDYGKVFILKNNQPDAVLISITEYERVSPFVEYIENLDDEELSLVIKSLPDQGKRKRYSLEHLHGDTRGQE
jgi:PHD/YefM family antitoxin component YafN of YafNO toxin-antitoxin module